MKKSGLLNPQLCAAGARLGHTQTFVVADAGLPIPHEVPVIDLAVVLEPRGSRRFSTPSSTKWSWREPRLLTRLSGMNRNLG